MVQHSDFTFVFVLKNLECVFYFLKLKCKFLKSHSRFQIPDSLFNPFIIKNICLSDYPIFLFP